MNVVYTLTYLLKITLRKKSDECIFIRKQHLVFPARHIFICSIVLNIYLSH